MNLTKKRKNQNMNPMKKRKAKEFSRFSHTFPKEIRTGDVRATSSVHSVVS